jgi:hypothetical protein
MEQQFTVISHAINRDLRATKSVFLPPIQLVIASKGYTLFKLSTTVRGPSEIVSFALERNSDLEVFRNMVLGPDFEITVVRIGKQAFLQCFPAEERVVTDEWRDYHQLQSWFLSLTLSTGGAVRDSVLDTPSEMCDTVLKEVVGDLHDSRHVLNDGDLG